MTSKDELATARSLWASVSLPDGYLDHLQLTAHPDSTVNSSFKLAEAAQTTIGLSALSAALVHDLYTGVKQDVSVDARHAVLEFRSESFYTLGGKAPGPIWDQIAGLYKTKDGHVRIHTNFPHHRHGILEILRIADTPDVTKRQVQNALLDWASKDFEARAAEAGMCAFALRSFEEWDRHPHAQALVGTLPVVVKKTGDAPKRQVGSRGGKHPLEGIKVLDLSRVLAGPTAGRTLAAHGADVLLITSPSLPALPTLDVDTSRGKRTTQLDITRENDSQKLRSLVGDADVFLQAYRPGALENRGFGINELKDMKGNREHGLVCANLDAWGFNGPWKDRRGFDSLVQTCTGFNVAEGQAYSEYLRLSGQPPKDAEPRPFPMQALDHAAGYLLAFGINTALSKTITEGGHWEVQVSLAAVGQWIRSLGRVSPEEAFGKAKPLPSPMFPQDEEIQRLSAPWTQSQVDNSRSCKRMTALKHAAVLSETPVREGRVERGEPGAPMVLNSSQAAWLH
ncbi:CoA-transferase family III [Dendrothele bispora CBS 962.96]|uniref:CoA-transferase family III n=1 Tax=Dendrothele bispora (strain CBS 962.96) TaxID=1314807 RepID=A0A4S8M9P8_DENBC|nr:CoA-transferase family III [Dendrothele bispora CBS 962.96]